MVAFMWNLIHCGDLLNSKVQSKAVCLKSQLHLDFHGDSPSSALRLASLVEVRVVFPETPAPLRLVLWPFRRGAAWL